MGDAESHETLNNAEISAIFEDIARRLEIRKDNIFKIRAYRKVAGSIKELTEPVAEFVKADCIREIPGAGEAIAKKLTELVETGRLEYYEKLKKEVAHSTNPPGR
jgi:DNA polymerase (family 10)